ncbi:MAG: hypothetical protein JOY62_14875 [Acidobacteriaceae bacterium]|nr:hypothetical protein [Acidobacteriaceae bacterium]MBV9781245.1 hypothetical protein [Acidobacteriaceae bacterium]
MSRTCFSVAISAVVLAGVAWGSTPPVEPFSDSFEGTQIYPYWALTQDYGTVTLSKDQFYSGAKSLEFASASGGERTIYATHKFPRHTKGTVSVAFYDYAPGQETLYEGLTLEDSAVQSHVASVGTNDYDAYCYKAFVGSDGQGPHANCGQYPGSETTNVKRTLGWHVFSISYDVSSVSIAIDGTVVYTANVAGYEFDTVILSIDGPYWRPNTIAYFDNFSFEPLPLYAKQ